MKFFCETFLAEKNDLGEPPEDDSDDETAAKAVPKDKRITVRSFLIKPLHLKKHCFFFLSFGNTFENMKKKYIKKF